MWVSRGCGSRTFQSYSGQATFSKHPATEWFLSLPSRPGHAVSSKSPASEWYRDTRSSRMHALGRIHGLDGVTPPVSKGDRTRVPKKASEPSTDRYNSSQI